MPANLRDYVQHKQGCARSPWPFGHRAAERYACSCGLSALLSSSSAERTEGMGCADCGLPYRDFPLDTTLPDEQWMAIFGRPGGFLCAGCIAKRAATLPGAVAVRARIEFTGDDEPDKELVKAVTAAVKSFRAAHGETITSGLFTSLVKRIAGEIRARQPLLAPSASGPTTEGKT